MSQQYTDQTDNGGQVGLNLPPPVVDPDDPLLIAQTLTYVTDDGSVLLSFTSAPFSFGKVIQMLICVVSKKNYGAYFILFFISASKTVYAMSLFHSN